MERLASILGQVSDLPKRSPWAWPVLMVVIGAGALAASWIVQPGADEWSYLFGHRFGGECGFQQTTGAACPSCGMTRSWLWLARGDVVRAFTYNAAGALLLLALVGTGVLGAVRLVTRDPWRWRVPFRWISSTVIAWMVGPYLLLWVARLLGFNPLP